MTCYVDMDQQVDINVDMDQQVDINVNIKYKNIKI